MPIQFGTTPINLQGAFEDRPDFRDLLRVDEDKVLAVFPPDGQQGIAFSLHSLSGQEVISAQVLDDSRYVAGSRVVEEQYIYGGVVEGDRLTLYFMEQGFDADAFSFLLAGYVRDYSLATGQPLGPARQGDAPAYFTPTSSDTLQTGTGLLAVGSKYGLTLMDENGRAVVAPDNLPPPGGYQNPNSFNGHAIVEIGDELMVLTTQTTRGGMFFQATSRIVGQKYLADGTAQGAEFEVIAGVTHPTNTPEASPVHDATFVQTAGGPVATGQEFTILDTAGNGIVTGGELIALTMSVTPPDSVDDPG
ncbi:hypothetical protein AB9K41_11075, partial [Cribrihabitans sp. XS_ASV171]